MAITEAAVTKKDGKHRRRDGKHRRTRASTRQERIADMHDQKNVATPRRKTITASRELVKTTWHVVDADGQVLGRLASEVAQLLRGKHKPTFSPNINVGDGVIVINAAKVRFTGKKLNQKMVRSHSGYPGGLREQSLQAAHEKDPAATIKRAVHGMLPHTKLGNEQFTHLRVYAGADHRHTAQEPAVYSLRFPRASTIHPSPLQACDAIGERDPVIVSSATERSSKVTPHRVKHKTSGGTSFETDDGDFLATFTSSTSNSYVWHTHLGAREALRICFQISEESERVGNVGEGGPAVGYFDSGEMKVRRDLSFEGLVQSIEEWVPESEVKLARLETQFDTFVWEAASPLQNGLDVPSLAIISESLTANVLDRLWNRTNGGENPELRRELSRMKDLLKA